MLNIVKTCVALSDSFQQSVRILLVVFCLSLFGECTADDYLTSELRTVEAVKAVLQSQQQLLQSKRRAAELLATEGHASALECSTAARSVQAKEQQISVCIQQIQLLRSLQQNGTHEKRSKVLIFDPSMLLQMPVRTPFVILSDLEDAELHRKLQELQALHSQKVDKISASAQHRITLLKDIQHRIERAEGLKPHAGGDLEFIHQQVTICQAEAAMLQSRTASLRLVSMPESLHYRGRQISREEIAALVSAHWNRNLLESRMKTTLAIAESMGRVLPAPSPRFVGWLPEVAGSAGGERQVTWLNERADAMGRVSSGLQNVIDSFQERGVFAWRNDHVHNCSDIMVLFIEGTSAESEIRHLVSRISMLSEQETTTAQTRTEIGWTSMRYQLAKAKSRYGDSVSQRVLSPFYHAAHVVAEDPQNAQHAFLAAFCDGEIEQARLDQETAARSISEARLDAIRSLNSEGHASWLELRHAEVELSRLNDAVVAAELELKSSGLRHEVLALVRSRTEKQETLVKVD